MSERFKSIPPFTVAPDYYPFVLIGQSERLMEFGDIGDLTVPEARALRDWIDAALPDDTATEPK